MKRNIPSENTGARTIPAKVNPERVLDLTKPVSQADIDMVNEAFKRSSKIAPPVTQSNILEAVQSTYQDLPYDAIKFTEHGQTNWAVNPRVEIKTPWGTTLTKKSSQSK